MTITSLYEHSKSSPTDFENNTGLSLAEFKELLPYFDLSIPRKLSIKERLFAILYVKKCAIKSKEIGQLMQYTNAARDGEAFIQRAEAALNKAKKQLPIKQEITEYVPIKIEALTDTASSPIQVTKPVKSSFVVDREFIKHGTDAIFTQVRFHSMYFNKNYYGLNEDKDEVDLLSLKWKTYLYLRKCLLDYRAGAQEELKGVIRFLEASNENRTWLAQRLTDVAVQEEENLWGSGSHEWLERCLIVDVLKRSAGMVAGVEAEISIGCLVPDYDWLYVQAIIRSPTKYVLFKNHEYTIENGHPGAVKPAKNQRGFASVGSPGFHQLLIEAFYASTTIEGFLKRILNIFKQELYSGKKTIHASTQKRYLIDGTRTNHLTEVGLFRKKKLLREGYLPFKELLRNTIEISTHFGDHIQEDISEVASDTTEEDIEDVNETADLNDSFNQLGI